MRVRVRVWEDGDGAGGGGGGGVVVGQDQGNGRCGGGSLHSEKETKKKATQSKSLFTSSYPLLDKEDK